MIDTDPLRRLEDWYAANSDGDWEHQHGVTIQSLDNPGWSVEIDLEGTRLEDASLHEVRVERSDRDWYRCWVESNVFHGRGGPGNLREMVGAFVQFSQDVSV